LAWDCGAGHYFDLLIRRHLVLNVFPFPVSKAKLIGEFYNNRRSAANQFPRFMFLMLRQYYWRCDSYSANRRILKIRENLIIGAANSPRFAYWRSEGAALRL
jgi:hypothetical protein